MALVLKQGKTVTDKFGNVYSDAYLVIDKLNINKKIKECYFVVDIYKDKQARKSGAKPFSSEQYYVFGADFDQWFPIGSQNQFAQAYDYIKQYKEDPQDDTLKYQDWEDLV